MDQKFGNHIIKSEDIAYQDKDFFIKFDNYPVSPGHILVITTGNEKDYFDLSEEKKQRLADLIEKAREIVEASHRPEGYNIGMNCGDIAGQTVMQFHCHLIPRYSGDMDDPRGGVRHCVAGKGYY
jgi:diadenosine tetraphosphate (Ap4A) HIT family hydrolase